MQATQDRDRDQLAQPSDVRRFLLRIGRLATEALTRPSHVVVSVWQSSGHWLAMDLAEDDDAIQQLVTGR